MDKKQINERLEVAKGILGELAAACDHIDYDGAGNAVVEAIEAIMRAQELLKQRR